MTAIKLHSGAWQFSAIVAGYLFTRTFYGYTRRAARELFTAAMQREAIR